MTQKKDNFIMLPKVDICFKGLMNNPKVRKGFIAALLQKDPETIRETELLPTVLRQDYPDEKLNDPGDGASSYCTQTGLPG